MEALAHGHDVQPAFSVTARESRPRRPSIHDQLAFVCPQRDGYPEVVGPHGRQDVGLPAQCVNRHVQGLQHHIARPPRSAPAAGERLGLHALDAELGKNA
jgi:hypothetical protein